MGLFFGNNDKKDRYNVQDYKRKSDFAEKWQYEFAMVCGCDEDEGYYEACAYWEKYHKK